MTNRDQRSGRRSFRRTVGGVAGLAALGGPAGARPGRPGSGPGGRGGEVLVGVAGLALSRWELSASDLRLHLRATATDVGLPADRQGSGRVDAAAAVATAPDGESGSDDAVCTREERVTVSDSLSGYWDADCWRYPWRLEEPCQVVVELEGPSDATFDLYVNEGGGCPTTGEYDHRSYTMGSEETIAVEFPDAADDLYVLVDAWSGSGAYDLTVVEKGN